MEASSDLPERTAGASSPGGTHETLTGLARASFFVFNLVLGGGVSVGITNSNGTTPYFFFFSFLFLRCFPANEFGDGGSPFCLATQSLPRCPR